MEINFKRFLSLALALMMVLSNVPVQAFATDDTVPACDEHDYSITVVDVEATCAEVGSKHLVCSVCGHENDPEEIPALGHTFVEGKCACGEEDPNYTPPETEHQHTWGDVYGSTATCEAEGIGYQACTAEGCTETQEITVAATGHAYVDGKCACGAAETPAEDPTEAPTEPPVADKGPIMKSPAPTDPPTESHVHTYDVNADGDIVCSECHEKMTVQVESIDNDLFSNGKLYKVGTHYLWKASYQDVVTGVEAKEYTATMLISYDDGKKVEHELKYGVKLPDDAPRTFELYETIIKFAFANKNGEIVITDDATVTGGLHAYTQFENGQFVCPYCGDVNVIDTAEELQAALNAGGTVVLGSNIHGAPELNVPAGVTVTLDLNGFTISSSASQTIDNNGALTVKDSAVNGAITNEKKYGIRNNQDATLTIEGGIITGKEDAICIFSNGTATIKNGTFNSIKSNGETIITGGTFNGKLHGTEPEYTITGGTFSESVSEEYVAEGYECKQNQDGTWTVQKKPEPKNEITGTITENMVWNDGDIVNGVTISGDVTITVKGTVTVTGTIRLNPDVISNVIFNGVNNAKLIRGSDFAGQMFYAEGVSGNFQNLTFNNITLDGGAVWTGEVDKTLNRGKTNEGVKATGSVLYLVYANADLNNSTLQNHDDSTGEKANAVFLRYYSTIDFNNSVVRNNNSISTYYRGGVITVRQGGTVKTNASEIYGNSGAAGGFFGISSTGAFGGVAEVYNSKFHNNYSDNGAVFLMQCNSNKGYLKIDGCEFYNNASKTAVLTEWSYSRPFIISNSNFHDNECAVWDCHADPILDLSGKIVVEEDPDYTKYLFETPMSLGGALSEGSSIAISEASLTKLGGTIIVGNAAYQFTKADMAKISLPEGYQAVIVDITEDGKVNEDGFGDMVVAKPAEDKTELTEITMPLKDSLNPAASETGAVYTEIKCLPVNPFAHEGLIFDGWVDANGKDVKEQNFTETATLTATWKIEAPVVKLSRKVAGENTLLATVTNKYNSITYTYQWYKADAAIEGATSAEYTISETADYKCVVTASMGELTPVTGTASGKAEYYKTVVAKIGDEGYETLKAAVEAANAIEGGATVTLMQDITLGEKLTISGNVTISGKYTITRDASYTGTLFEVATGAALTLDGGLVVDGGNEWTFDKTSYEADLNNMTQVIKDDYVVDGVYQKYVTPEANAPVATAHMITVSAGTVNLKNVTFQNEFGKNAGVVKTMAAGSAVTLEGAKIQHIASMEGNGVAVNSNQANTITMNAGTVMDGNYVGGNHGMFMIYSGTKMIMNGGEIKNTKGWNSNGVAVGIYGTGSELTMNGGLICGSSSVWGQDNGRNMAVYAHSSGKLTMNGGTICHNIGKEYGGGIGSYKESSVIVINGGKVVDNISLNNDNRTPGVERGDDVDVAYDKVLTITGGTFGHDVFKWVAPGYGQTYDAETGYYTVTDKIAAIGDKTYASVADAVKNAVSGNTITVLASHKIPDTVVIDKNVTLDLNGQTIYGYNTVNPIIRVLADVTVNGDGMIDTADYGDGYCFIVGNSDGVSGNLTIENGTFKGSTTAVSVTKGTATLLGGNFSVKPYEDSYEYLLNCIDANYKDESAKIIVKGGVFTNFNPESNAAEGANTNFCADSYIAEELSANVWTVRQVNYVAKVGETRYQTLKDAVAAANAIEGGATVTLLKDITLGEKLTISGNVTISGEYTITRDASYTGTLFTVNAGAALTLDDGLTIDGGNAWVYTKGTPELDMANGAGTYVANHITPAEGGVNATAHLIANNGTLNANKVTIQNSYSTNGVSAIDCGASSVTTLNGALIQNIAANRSGAVVYVGGIDAVLNIKGETRITGNFGTGNGGIIQNYGQSTTVNMEGGSIDNNHIGKSGTLYASYSGNANKINTFNMSGGVITNNVMEGYGPVYIHTNTVWNMTGGEISNNTSLLPNYVRSNNNAATISGGKIVNNEVTYTSYATRPDIYLGTNSKITGGAYTQDVTGYLAPDLGLAYDANTGIYTVTDRLAAIGENVYTSVAKAAKAAVDGDTIIVLASYKASETAVIDKNVTLDLNGKNIYGYGTVNPIIRVLADVTVNGDGMIDTANYGDGYCFIIGNSDGVSGNLTIENGTFKGNATAVSVTKGTATLLGGEYIVKPYENSYNYLLNCIDANYKDSSAKIFVKGGVFTNFNPENNAAEGANTNFCAAGYIAEEMPEGNKWTVCEDKNVAQVGEIRYQTLKDAVAAANAIEGGATVIMLKDVTLGEKLTISGNVTISGEHTITRADNYTGTLFNVNAGATLTLDGGLVIDGGNNYAFNMDAYKADLEAMNRIPDADAAKYFTPEEGAPVASAFMITLTKGTSAEAFGGTVNLKNVTIQNNYSTGSGIVSAAQYTETNLNGAKITHNACTKNSGVAVNASGAGIKVNMYKGTVIDGNHVGGNHGIFKIYSGTVFTMHGGEVTHTTGWNSNGTVVGLYGGTFVMNGGLICSNSSVYGPSNGRNAAIYLHASGVMEMNGGTICHNTGISRGGIDSSKSSSKLTITGGNVLYNNSLAGNSTSDVGGTVGTWTITGGSYTQDVSAWLAPDYGLAYDADTGIYTVTKDIAAIGEVVYTSVAKAAKAAKDGDIITVLASYKASETAVIDKNVTLNLNGKNIYGYGTVNPIIRVLADVTVNGNGMIDTANYGDGYCFIVGSNDGAGNLTIENGTFKGSTTAVSVTKGTATLLDGDFRVKPYENNYNYLLNCIDANYKDGTAKIFVKGGVFTNFNPESNAAEGANTNFCATGYVAEELAEGNKWIVKKQPKVTITIADATMVAGNALPEFEFTTDIDAGELKLNYTVDGNTSVAGECTINATVEASVEGYEFTVIPGKLTVEKAVAKAKVKNVETFFATLQEAYDKADSRVDALDHIELKETLKINRQKAISIYMNGKNLSGALDTLIEVDNNGYTFSFSSAAKVTNTGDVFFIKSGNVNIYGACTITSAASNCVYTRGGRINIQKAILVSNGDYPAIQGNGMYTGNVTISGGSVSAPNSDIAIYWPQNGTLTVEGGKITGKTALYAKSGTIVINGGEFIATGDKVDFAHNSNGASATGDAVVIESCKDAAYETPSVTVTSGTFTSANAKAFAVYNCNENAPLTKFISGGVFNTDIEDALVIEDHRDTENEDGTWTIKKVITITLDDQTVVVGNKLEFTYTVEDNLVIDGLKLDVKVDGDVNVPGTYNITATAKDSAEHTYEVIGAKLTVLAAVCAIGDVNYASLSDAIQSVPKGQTAETTTIKLLVPELQIKSIMVGHQYAQNITIDLNGGKIYSTDKTLTAFRSGTTLTLTNGTVSGNSTGGTLVATYGGKLVLGENLTVTSGGQATAIKVDNGILEINSDVDVVGGKYWLSTTANAKNSVIISAGDFTSGMSIGEGTNMQLTGGWYDVEIKTEWCVAPHGPKYYAQINRWTVADGNITVDGVWFDSWDDAESSIKKNSTIVLYDDAVNYYGGTVARDFKFPTNGGNITLDLNGHTFKSAQSDTSKVTSVSVQYGTVLNIIGSGKIVIENNSYPFTINPKATVKIAEGIEFNGTMQWNVNSGNSGDLYIGETALVGVNGIFKPNEPTRIVMNEAGDWTLSMGSLSMTTDDATLENNTLTINNKCSIDLNGHNLTAKNVSVFGTLIDTKDGVGSVKVSENYYYSNHANMDYFPLFDSESDAYRLYKTEVKTRQIKLQDADTLKYWFTVYFNKAEAYKLLADMVADNNLHLSVDWTGSESAIQKDFSAEMLKKFANTAYSQMVDKGKVTTTLTQLVTGASELSVGDYVESEASIKASIGVIITEAVQKYQISK